MPPLVVDVINNHRAALLAREQAAMQANARAWLQVEQSIQAQVDALAYELANSPAATMGQLQRSRRYRALMEQTRAELRKYEDYLEPRIRSGQADMITAAMEHSRQAVNAVATEAQVVVQFDRLPVSAVNDAIGLAGDGSPLRAVLQDASRVGPDALADQLVSGIALGKNPVAVARQAIRLGLGQSFTRMQTVYRTEMLRTYRQTTLASYGNSNIIAGYTRISARDSRVCAGCLMSDGRFYPVDYGFDQHPNCIVGGTVVNSPQILATSKRWFDGQVIEIRTINGHVLTVTENHPILTDKGWISAHLLKVGDNVISSLDSERTISSADPNSDGRPSVIEDVIESFARPGGMASVSVPTSTVDFHGDGGHGNVSIVWADSLLQDWRQSAFSQPTGEHPFHVGGMGLSSFFTDSAVAQLLERSFLADGGSVHGGGKSLDFFGSALARHDAVGFRLPSYDNTSLEQALADGCTRSVVASGNSIFGHTRAVQLQHIIVGQAYPFPPHHRDTGNVKSPTDSGAASIESGSEFFFRHAEAVQADEFINGDVDNIICADLPSLLCGDSSLLGMAPHQSALSQLGSEQFSRSMPTISSDITAIAGGIVSDRILEVSRRHFSGHVYNLQTSTGWYIAGGIITHNCRCSLIPRLRNVPPVQYQDGQSWFRQQPESTQRAILGRGRFEIWRDGRASLDDMVTRIDNPTWGGSLVPTPVRDLGVR